MAPACTPVGFCCLKSPNNRDANLFRDQLLCQDDSAKDILESFNELSDADDGGR